MSKRESKEGIMRGETSWAEQQNHWCRRLERIKESVVVTSLGVKKGRLRDVNRSTARRWELRESPVDKGRKF